MNQRPSLLAVHVPRHYFDTCLLQKKINNFCNSSPPPAIIAVYVLYQKCIVGLICPDLAARRVKKKGLQLIKMQPITVPAPLVQSMAIWFVEFSNGGSSYPKEIIEFLVLD